jgi:hypothetical protein
MRLIGIGFAAMMLVACGGGGDGEQLDAGLPTPQVGSAASPTAADFSCNGSRDDCTLPLYAGITCPPDPGFTVAGEVQDFQSKDNVVSAISPTAVATVTVYATTADVLSDTPLVAPVESGSDGRYSVTIPESLTRVIFKTVMTGSKDTYEFNQIVAPGETDNHRFSVSNATGDFINAWVGMPFDTAKGAVAGALRDCQQHEVANAVGRALDGSGGAVIPDEQIFYFSDAAGLPVKRSKRTYSDFDGRMLFLNVPPTTSGVTIQAWVNADGTGAAELLVSENVVPVVANAIVITDLDPLSAN